MSKKKRKKKYPRKLHYIQWLHIMLITRILLYLYTILHKLTIHKRWHSSLNQLSKTHNSAQPNQVSPPPTNHRGPPVGHQSNARLNFWYSELYSWLRNHKELLTTGKIRQEAMPKRIHLVPGLICREKIGVGTIKVGVVALIRISSHRLF